MRLSCQHCGQAVKPTTSRAILLGMACLSLFGVPAVITLAGALFAPMLGWVLFLGTWLILAMVGLRMLVLRHGCHTIDPDRTQGDLDLVHKTGQKKFPR